MLKILVKIAELITWLLLSPFFLTIKIAKNEVKQQERFHLCSELISMLPFRIGLFIRRVFYRQTLSHCGTNPIIRMGTIFVYPQAKIGDHVFIGNRCVIGLATIGDDVLISHHVSVLSGRHHHKNNEDDQLLRLQETQIQRVNIGSNSWIGANSTIMADIGDNTTVGAGAVVVQPIPPSATAVGNPARVIENNQV